MLSDHDHIYLEKWIQGTNISIRKIGPGGPIFPEQDHFYRKITSGGLIFPSEKIVRHKFLWDQNSSDRTNYHNLSRKNKKLFYLTRQHNSLPFFIISARMKYMAGPRVIILRSHAARLSSMLRQPASAYTLT